MLSNSDNCFPNSWEMSSLGLRIRAHRVDGGNGMAHRQAGDLHVTAAATFGKVVAKRTSGVSATNSVAFFRLRSASLIPHLSCALLPTPQPASCSVVALFFGIVSGQVHEHANAPPDRGPARQCSAVLDRNRSWHGDALCGSRAQVRSAMT